MVGYRRSGGVGGRGPFDEASAGGTAANDGEVSQMSTRFGQFCVFWWGVTIGLTAGRFLSKRSHRFVFGFVFGFGFVSW